ncbi:MAG TPA: DNA alkylation repair protein [Candidatus Thermoplasmatota archaeon]|nr:DNA alkylation repair protein [Candidatus Thermoplasmatota archaeon]
MKGGGRLPHHIAALLPAQRTLRALGSPARAKISASYFRTGPGEYGEGDVFIGVAVPAIRRLTRASRDLAIGDVARLLSSKVHEDRLLAVLILVDRARASRGARAAEVARFYMQHLDRVNNWDLVDSSAPQILGPYLETRPLAARRTLLDRLARSRSVWRRRVAMLTTQHFIRRGETRDALRLARALLADDHDLIHKAAGWMLREVGDRDPAALRGFLARHAGAMPRTMLRYAVEKIPVAERRRWMKA